MKSICILGHAVAAGTAVLLLSVLNAAAQPVPGAYYFGNVTGAGDIHFNVSAGGDEVRNLTVTQIPCNGGTHDQFTWPVPIPIVDDEFDMTLEPLATRVTGQFLTAASAQGTLRLVLDEPACDSGTLNWTATSSGTPTPPPVGGIAELEDISGSSAFSQLALAVLVAAALGALTAGAWYAGRGRLH